VVDNPWLSSHRPVHTTSSPLRGTNASIRSGREGNSGDILEKQDDEPAEIQANGELLEFTVNPFKSLAARKADLGFSELVWMTAHRIEVELHKWKDTIWSEIDVSRLSNECENYSKEILKIEKGRRTGLFTTGLML
jgi:hypothetical protein